MYTEFQRTFELGEEIVPVHEKRLLKNFLKRRVRKSILARFIALRMHFFLICKELNANTSICIKNFNELSK